MSVNTFIIPNYTPENFINCKDSIEIIEDAVYHIHQATLVKPRVVIFSGTYGSGKSWLILHLARTILPNLPATQALLFHFSQFRSDIMQNCQSCEWNITAHIDDTVDTLIFDVIHWLAKRLHVEVEATAPSKDCINAIVEHVRMYLHQEAIILLCDDLLEYQDDFLSQIEQHVLAPLGVLQNVIFVMTSRGKMVNWESPYLQLATFYQSLQPFAITDIEQQLAHQEPKAVRSVDQIERYGAGHPISNLFLAQEVDLHRALQAIIVHLLGFTPKHAEEQMLSDALDALCILNGFREDEIALMLAAYYDDIDINRWDTTSVRNIRDMLTDMRLVYWSQDQFVIHKPLRHTLEKRLQLQRRGMWLRLHCRAYCLYQTWAHSYPQVAKEYRQRADYHRLVLWEENIYAEDCECYDSPTL